jgi:hypothetical protein
MTDNLLSQSQLTVNERLKFLIKALKISARAFSAQLEVPESSTRNYLDKGTKLNSDFLERIGLHFENVNLNWLITGKGEPLSDQQASTTQTGNFNQAGTGNKQVVKGKGSVVGTNLGIITHTSLPACEKENAHLRTQIELLKGQLESKDALIAAKDEMLNFLRGGFNRPN